MRMIQDLFEKIQYGLEQRPVLFDVLLLLFAMAYVLSGVALVPFHGDESAYLILSEDYDRIVKEGRVDKVLYTSEGGSKQYLRVSTGGILPFTIGLARDLADNEDPIQKWLWGSSWEENLAMGNMPPEGLLNLARFCSAVMGALSVVIFFLFAQKLSGSRLAAWVATLALATQGAFLVNIRRAMQEGPKFLFLVLAAYISVYIVKNLKTSNMSRIPYALLGIASGLTLATKQDTAPMLAAIYLALAFIPVYEKLPVSAIAASFLYLGTATIIAYAVFLVCMPVFWGWWESALALTGIALILFQLTWFKRNMAAKFFALAGCVVILGATITAPSLWLNMHIPLASMFELREGIVEVQLGDDSSQGASNPAVLAERARFLFINIVSSRVMYMEVPSFDVPPYHDLIRVYESSIYRGRTGSLIWDGVIALLALSGIWTLMRKVSAESLFVLFLLLITGVSLFVLIPLLWQRYHLIMQIPYLLTAGIGARQLWYLITTRWKAMPNGV